MVDAKKIKINSLEDYDSDFEEDEERQSKKVKRQDLATTETSAGSSKTTGNHSAGLPSRDAFDVERGRADGYKYSYLSLNAFERHKKLINDYYLYYPGSKKVFERDTSKDKTDHDVIRDHHRFIWSEEEDADTWEKQLSKKYYDKLFKEYCICDLTYYQQGKYAMRWRTEAEVINGKGQFTCAARKCNNGEKLRSWEVNFAYMEDSIKKNALVKLRLCTECSIKLNHHKKLKDVTKTLKKKNKRKRRKGSGERENKGKRERRREEIASDSKELSSTTPSITEDNSQEEKSHEQIWKDPVQLNDAKSREEEFDDYLDDLFL